MDDMRMCNCIRNGSQRGHWALYYPYVHCMEVDQGKLNALRERFPHSTSETISRLLLRHSNDFSTVQSILSDDLYNGEEKNREWKGTPYKLSVGSNHDPSQSQANLSPTSPDYAYVQALLLHQRARLDAMNQSVDQARESLQQLQREVSQKEQQHSQSVSDYSGMPSDEDLDFLRGEIQSLEASVDDLRRESQALKAAKGVILALNVRLSDMSPFKITIKILPDLMARLGLVSTVHLTITLP
eukprot:m.8858 g.8858  ORF g.8858 m.8858 type:complete len:242 (+) comp20919_c0_seq1:35-760(+)